MTTPVESPPQADKESRSAADANRERLQRRQEALERFERVTELPLLVLALAFIPLLAIPLLVELPASVEALFLALDWLIWAAFAVEYVVRLSLSVNRWRFVRRQWPDLLIVILPFLRPLRIMRSARALRLLRLTRLVALLSVAARQARRLLVRRRLHLVILVTALVGLVSATLMFAVEEGGQEGDIDSFGDALWWAISTITTVGYGDVYPTTPAGRVIAIGLMVTGVAFFAVLAGNLAAFFLDRIPEEEKAERQLLEEVLKRLDVIEKQLTDRNR